MIPSRGLIQVNLDDPDIRAGSCKPPVAQVKILRRPNPSSDHSINESSSKPITEVLKSNGTDKMHMSNESSIFSEEWPSIADAAKCSRSQINKLNSSTKEPPNKATTEPKIICKNNQIHQPTVSKKSMPIKSYKERADEYAKARLRILGSAFSEDNLDEKKP